MFHNAEGRCGDRITRSEGTEHRSEARGAAVVVLCVDGSTTDVSGFSSRLATVAMTIKETRAQVMNRA